MKWTEGHIWELSDF